MEATEAVSVVILLAIVGISFFSSGQGTRAKKPPTSNIVSPEEDMVLDTIGGAVVKTVETEGGKATVTVGEKSGLDIRKNAEGLIEYFSGIPLAKISPKATLGQLRDDIREWSANNAGVTIGRQAAYNLASQVKQLIKSGRTVPYDPKTDTSKSTIHHS